MERGKRTGSRRIALLIQYDGTAFNGWQVQNRGRTVQGEIEGALKVLARESIRITGSGRTDAGVHALAQVAHFDLNGMIPLERICIGLNGIINRDVSILNAYHVPDGFNARFSAVSREYTYLIYNHPQRSPFMRHRAMWVNFPIDLEHMRTASSCLTGEKDFESFCKKISAEGGTVRKIESIDIHKTENLIVVKIRGNAFLHTMIRVIIGTLVALNKEKRDPLYMHHILEQKNRDLAGATAPPYGLYLSDIVFDPPLSSMNSAFK